ncbi:cyanophycinase [Pseudoalteromonas sp. MMG022]|uniref:cyanophycinase n=1 Tax=Pseudoalteromonas sp. MMG022 TaxID=2909978 RepID=UPI001F160605|nr:cyanophycinase [Pseudoalteromonas sp. MMG022]MCF6437496.1 cyanophycinase [Pseudoalteromonas sp. MMG022]
MNKNYTAISGGFRTVTLACISMLFSAFSQHLLASQQSQTLVLIGGTLTTCSSMSPKNCNNKGVPKGKSASNFQITEANIKRVDAQWPSKNTAHKAKILNLLSKMANQHTQTLSKKRLLWAWRDTNNQLLNQLSDAEYYFVLDMLEVPVLDAQGRRIKEQVATHHNAEPASVDILNFIKASASVATKSPSLLAVTASSRDPYESADFYEGLLSQTGIQATWLPLTPALAKAITSGQCKALGELRTQVMQAYNREVIYTDRVKAEQQLCEQGVAHLVKLIASATGIMFNGGDQSLTKQVLFDDEGKPYPWTQTINERPLLIGTSAGTAVQSGSKNQFGQVAMITNGTSVAAMEQGAHAVAAPSARCIQDCQQGLSGDALTYQADGGLGSFNFGILDTHFSERNRSVRLATLLAHTGQRFGFGVDETTALVVIRSAQGEVMTVVGKHGVVHIKSISPQSFSYSYWPSGTYVDVGQDGFSIHQRTLAKVLTDINIPALPEQRFAGILEDAKLRSLTQAMCLAKQQQAQAKHEKFNFTFLADDSTRYLRVNKTKFGCAIENLKISYSNNH